MRLAPAYASTDSLQQSAAARWLRRLYSPPGTTAVVPLEPDTLAEVLVARELAARPELIAACLDTAADRQLARALLVISRAASTRGDLAQACRPALDDRLAGLVARIAGEGALDPECPRSRNLAKDDHRSSRLI